MFLPDVHVLGYLKGGFNVSRKDGVEASCDVLVVDDGLVLSDSLRLGVDGILELPILASGVLSKIPPVIEHSKLVSWYFSAADDGSLDSFKLICRHALVHLNEASGLELREPEISDFLNDGCLGRGREDVLHS